MLELRLIRHSHGMAITTYGRKVQPESKEAKVYPIGRWRGIPLSNEDNIMALQRGTGRLPIHLILAPVQVPSSSAQSHIQVAAQPTAPLASILCVLIRQVLLHYLSAHMACAECDIWATLWGLRAHSPAVIQQLCSMHAHIEAGPCRVTLLCLHYTQCL